MDHRLQLIHDWLHGELGLAPSAIEPASSDASFRRYFRATTATGPLIVMDAPPEHEDIRPFKSIAQTLESRGVHVPHIHASCEARGLMLLEDLGSTPYLARLTEESADQLYGAAMDTLMAIQAAPTEGLPHYDEALLMREMRLFDEWFLGRHLGMLLEANEESMFEDVYRRLADHALRQKQVFVHRDYHSRNLMVTSERPPGVIDFQDAVLGPVTYDLVSLIRDSYMAWPHERVTGWADAFHDQLTGAGIIDIDRAAFREDLDLMSAQRHLKVAGIFARLNHRDGKSGYLKDIPVTLRNLFASLGPYAEFDQFLQWLGARLPEGLRP